MTRVAAGQLWREARTVDTCAFRTVHWLPTVRASAVTAALAAGDWRPTLQSWGLGAPLVEVSRPYCFTTTVAALHHQHFIQLADPQHVGRVLPGTAPVQGTLLELTRAVA